MTVLFRAFAWLRVLRTLRPLRPGLEPAVAVILFACGTLSVASAGFWGYAITLAAAIGVAFARLQPGIALGCVAFSTFLWLISAPDLALGWTIVLDAISIGVVAASRRGAERWLALGLAVAAPFLFGASSFAGDGGRTLGLFVTLLVGAWGLGTAAAEARGRLRAVTAAVELVEKLEVSETEVALAAERERVAREVHDIVAHSLAVILAQAEGARALAAKRPAAMEDSLGSIADAARGALLDVRGIVDGITGGIEPPQPTLDDLPELLRGVEDAGLVVLSTSAGDRVELGSAQETAVYRIVQEGATNAIRHRGRGSSLTVVLDWRGPGLSLQIVSSGAGDAVAAHGAGRGIPGMTERARIAGGWLAAGEDEAGDHRITAFVPFRESAHAAEWATHVEGSAP